MRKPTSRLGRGLTTLIPTPTSSETKAEDMSRGGDVVTHIPIDSVRPNPRQPRTSFSEASLAGLAESIRTNGVVQPIIVRHVEQGYELVAGERRLRAAKMAGMQIIPAIIRYLGDRDALELALIENLQREDLTPIERATAYRNYLEEFGGTVDDLAKRLGESRANVSNYLRLLSLDPEVCYMLGAGELSMGQARAIAAIEDRQRQIALAKIAVRRNLSVRQVENLVRQLTSEAGREERSWTIQSVATRRHCEQIAQAFSKAIGMPVRVFAGRKKNSGRVVISFRNLEEFELLAGRLGVSLKMES